ncbi:MAG TPA: outer membrane beta-barrel protein, partial [Candidatus Binatia bacterium]
NNTSPSFHGGFSFTPADAFSLATSIMYGPEQRNHDNRQRFTISNVATIKVISDLTFFVEYTYGHEDKATASLRDATWQGVAAIASYDWTDRFNTSLRAEFFKDTDGVRTIGSGLFGASQPKDTGLGELTLTGAYKFTKMLLGRMEVRQDWADQKVFALGNSGRADKSQTTLALQLIYTY